MPEASIKVDLAMGEPEFVIPIKGIRWIPDRSAWQAKLLKRCGYKPLLPRLPPAAFPRQSCCVKQSGLISSLSSLSNLGSLSSLSSPRGSRE